MPASSLASTWLMVKLAGVCEGGNSTTACGSLTDGETSAEARPLNRSVHWWLRMFRGQAAAEWTRLRAARLAA